MADTSKNRDQLIQRALKNLGIIEPGEAPSPEDYATMDDLIDPLVAQLAADRIVSIQDIDAIELQYYEPVARLLANMAGPDFGSPINDQARLTDEATLRRFTASAATYQPVKTLYF